MPVVLLFSKPSDYNASVPKYLIDKYPNVEAFVYPDNRMDKSYIPSIRPYLWWQYLKADPNRQNEDYLYIDSDVIFREWLNFDEVRATPTTWYGSDCSGYIAYDYIKQCERGPEILQAMADIAGIRVEQMQGVPGIGAQLVISHPTIRFWEKSYRDTMTVWHYLDGTHSNIQKWTAEMWAQLWAMVAIGITPMTCRELDFSWSTDPIEKWEQTKILHNSGVTEPGKGMFFKGGYKDHTPFGENFEWVDKTKCSRRYVDAVEKVIH